MVEGYHGHLLIEWSLITHSIQKLRSDLTKTAKTIHCFEGTDQIHQSRVQGIHNSGI